MKALRQSGAFLMPTQVLFGMNCLDSSREKILELKPKKIAVMSSRSMVNNGALKRLEEQLKGFELNVFLDIGPEPDFESLENALAFVRNSGADTLIGLGGGSVLDVAKAAATLAKESGPAIDFFKGKALSGNALQFVAIPSTAGTGAEVTRAAVIGDKEAKLKRVLKNDCMFPKLAIVDPSLTFTCPKAITVGSGFDAFTHALEAFTNLRANEMTDGLCREAMHLITENLSVVCDKPNDKEARSKMAHASTIAGIAIANNGAGACHGISHSIGGKFDVHHGRLNAMLLPAIMKFNMSAAKAKFTEVAKMLGGKTAHDLPKKFQKWAEKAGIEFGLHKIGIKEQDFHAIAKDSFYGSFFVNPRKASKKDVVSILKAAL